MTDAVQYHVPGLSLTAEQVLGLCECGCGQRTTVPNSTDRANGRVRGAPMRFVTGHNHPPRAARRTSSQGYVLVPRPNHPRSTAGYVFEHILVAEAALGRPLSAKHPVHHHDENRQNNVGGNLVICQDRKYHSLLHQRMRAFSACGNPSARACARCGLYDRQDQIRLRVTGAAYHGDCNAVYERERYHAKRGSVA